MPEVNQYIVAPREILEMIVRSAGVREGQWYLMANFGFTAGNFGATPAQLVPGVAITIQSLGIQRATPEAQVPPESIIDASKIWGVQKQESTKSGKTKTST
jgi:hypothetical protein